MISRFILLVLLVCACSVSCATNAPKNANLTEICLGCICETTSNCNKNLGCKNGICGLFQITRPYWEDAGKVVLDDDDKSDPEAFERCVTDRFCAAKTVDQFMKKYGKDCDKNGNIDCEDYMSLHFLGAGCKGNIARKYPQELKTLRQCLQDTASLFGNA